MASVSPPSPPAVDSCQESDPSDPAVRCGAALAAHDRCLAHLDADQLSAYLATLSPGSDVDARGVTFRPGLLGELLRSLRSGQNVNRVATFGKANFTRAIFSESASFRHVSFLEGATFDEATFNGGIHFYRVNSRWTVSFSLAQFAGRTRFSKAAFENADFSFARFANGATFLIKAKELKLYHATFSGNMAVEATIGALSA